jgi:hypothetical protein
MPRWIKFVALFMLTFAVFDVCSPERCEAQVEVPIQSSVQFHADQNPGGGDSCQFEEDCFNCAHFTPGTGFVLQPIGVIAFTRPDMPLSSIEEPLLTPYHPPRT